MTLSDLESFCKKLDYTTRIWKKTAPGFYRVLGGTHQRPWKVEIQSYLTDDLETLEITEDNCEEFGFSGELSPEAFASVYYALDFLTEWKSLNKMLGGASRHPAFDLSQRQTPLP